MPDRQNQIPTFDQVMQKDTQNGKIPSFEDIMGDEEKVKKKEPSGLGSKIGGTVGTADIRSETPSQNGKKAVSGALSNVFGNPINDEEKQKVLDYLYSFKSPDEKNQSRVAPLTTSSEKFKKNERPFDQTKEEFVKESTQKLNNIMYGDGDEWKDPIGSSVKGIKKSESIKDALGYQGAMTLAESSLAPDGFEANRVLNSTLLGMAGEDNLTANLLKKKATEYNNATKHLDDVKVFGFLDWEDRDKFYEGAMKFYAEKNPHFKKQVEVAGLPTSEETAKRGQIVAQVMNDPDFIAYITKQNPEMLKLVDDVQKNFYADNKDYAINSVANKVSREVQKSGYNDIDPIFNFYDKNHKEYANTIAELTLTPEELKIWNENIKNNQEKYMDAPSFFEGFATSGKNFGKGIWNTFKQPFESASKTIKEGWEKEATNVSADPQGLSKYMRDFGGATGLVSSIITTGNVTGIANPQTAGMVATGLGFFGDQLEQGKIKYPNSPVKAWTSAALNTSMYIALSTNIGAKNAKAAFAEVQPQVSNVIENLTKGSITREVARRELNTLTKKAIDFVGGSLKKQTKISAELGAIAAINQGFDKVAGLEGYEQFHPENEVVETFKKTFWEFLPITAFGKYGEMRKKNILVQDNLFEAATNPKRYERVIEELSIKYPTINVEEMKGNLNFLVSTLEGLKQQGVEPKNQKVYLYNAMAKKAIEESKVKTPESTLTRTHSERIKNLEEVNEGILQGKDAEEIVTISEQKIIDEQKKNEIELQRLEKDKEFDDKEFDKKRKELDGRNPDDKIKIEKLEEDKRRKDEDFEAKAEKLRPKKEEEVKLVDQERELDTGGGEKTQDDLLLEEIQSKSGEGVKDQDLNFFVDQAANAPNQFYERYGQEVTDKLLSKATDEQLTRGAVNLAKFDPNNPAIDILDKELARREAEQSTTTEGLKEGEQPTVSESEKTKEPKPSTVSEPLEGKGEVSTVKTKEEGRVSELEAERDAEIIKQGKPKVDIVGLKDEEFAKLSATKQNEYEEWEKEEINLRKLIDCLWKK